MEHSETDVSGPWDEGAWQEESSGTDSRSFHGEEALPIRVPPSIAERQRVLGVQSSKGSSSTHYSSKTRSSTLPTKRARTESTGSYHDLATCLERASFSFRCIIANEKYCKRAFRMPKEEFIYLSDVLSLPPFFVVDGTEIREYIPSLGQLSIAMSMISYSDDEYKRQADAWDLSIMDVMRVFHKVMAEVCQRRQITWRPSNCKSLPALRNLARETLLGRRQLNNCLTPVLPDGPRPTPRFFCRHSNCEISFVEGIVDAAFEFLMSGSSIISEMRKHSLGISINMVALRILAMPCEFWIEAGKAYGGAYQNEANDHGNFLSMRCRNDVQSEE